MPLNGSYNSTANVNNSADATFAVIAADANRRWEIATLVVSGLDAGNFILKSGTTNVIGPIYIPANTTITFNLNDTIKLAKGEAFNLTKSTAGHTYTVYCQYRDMG